VEVNNMTIFWVDLPDPAIAEADDDNAYINVGQFDSKQEALDWLLEVHGMPPEVAEFFITEGAQEDE
jgi:hypothetical protein